MWMKQADTLDKMAAEIEKALPHRSLSTLREGKELEQYEVELQVKQAAMDLRTIALRLSEASDDYARAGKNSNTEHDMSTSHDSKIEVTIKLVVDIETESHPGDILDDTLKNILTENVADTLAQYNDEDIKAAITEYRVIETEMRE